MIVIYKYTLEFTDETQEVLIHKNATILTAQFQFGNICVWAAVDPDEPYEHRKFVIIGTGHGTVPSSANYVGTVQQSSYVWHVFEGENL